MANTFENYRYEGDELYITCNRCNTEKHCSDYWKNRNNSMLGYYYSCKQCGNNKVTNLDTADESIANSAKEILIAMGFDIDKPIHPQFCERMKDKHGIDIE